jgi:aspartyl-tRNA(Asn)/glutamyl-tRNA(Gln) amidotransferase subunit C
LILQPGIDRYRVDRREQEYLRAPAGDDGHKVRQFEGIRDLRLAGPNAQGDRQVALTADDVASLARLARIELTEAELEVLAPQLDVILESVARVSEVAAQDIPPTSHALPLTNVFRDDELRPSLPREQILAGAPAAELMRFRVPRILGEEA